MKTAFRKIHPCPDEDPLMLSRHLHVLARETSFEPLRYFTGSRKHTPAWPPALLEQARRRANGSRAITFA